MYRKQPHTRLSRLLRACISALFLALICILLTPLSAFACGGLFTADSYTEQSAERMVFAVNSTQVTLYEQIKYTGSPQNFAWVLPLPAVPQIGTAPISLFQELDTRTTPTFYQQTLNCDTGAAGSAAPPSGVSANGVNVDSSGTVGPYSYDVIHSDNPQALTQWLNTHHYKIPAESQTEMQPYISAHMFFLAMRLQGNAGVQNMTPVKITYASTQQQITIPLRMATPMSKERLGVLVWIFGKSRYTSQNYQSLQLSSDQINTDPNPNADYTKLVDQAVDTASGGHGFITDYAQPTSNLSGTDNADLQNLVQHYSYLTRLYTDMSPAHITLDPTFGPAKGLPDVDAQHILSTPPPVCWPPAITVGGVLVLGTTAFALIVVFVRRRKIARTKPE